VGGALGFCTSCGLSYIAQRARRRRFVEAVCARLIAAGDPVFAVFGAARPRCFGAHVAAHLVELEARDVHVPPAAVRDYIEELDERARVGA
jgi:hypothetical protein